MAVQAFQRSTGAGTRVWHVLVPSQLLLTAERLGLRVVTVPGNRLLPRSQLVTQSTLLT